LLESKVVVKIA